MTYRAPHAAACAAVVAIEHPIALLLWEARGKPEAEQEAAREEVERLEAEAIACLAALGWTRADLDAEAYRKAAVSVAEGPR